MAAATTKGIRMVEGTDERSVGTRLLEGELVTVESLAAEIEQTMAYAGDMDAFAIVGAMVSAGWLAVTTWVADDGAVLIARLLG